MNTPPNLPFTIEASYLGPIFFLKGDLSKYNQNLIFATNGTGKSFLSRAFYYLDLHGQGEDICQATSDLVSEEAKNGNGSFSFSRGSDVSATLNLEKSNDNLNANISNIIFHVFCEDFVRKELREREFKVQNNIEKQITIGSENIEIQSEQEKLREMLELHNENYNEIQENLEKEMKSSLVEKVSVNKKLTEYKEINLEKLLEKFLEKPNLLKPNFTDIIKDLDTLKAIPSEPIYPEFVNIVEDEDSALEMLAEYLQKTTSPSSVSEKIKQKINSAPDFYKTGARMFRKEQNAECPFCEQEINDPNPKELIEAYINYFAAEEEKHKTKLCDLREKFKQKEKNLENVENQVVQQKLHYDNLKQHIPSKKDDSINNAEDVFRDIRGTISTIVEAIERKTKTLAIESSLPKNNLSTYIASINRIIQENNTEVNSLVTAVDKADTERIQLHREACKAFEHEFATTNWDNIKSLKDLQRNIDLQKRRIRELENTNPPEDARKRVAQTFKILLKKFFASKYVFDDQKSALKRDGKDMQRGPHRTLSDGEKTAIAFCWFVACIHRKVETNEDYSNIFLIFDDPVTSMSYDFIFSIAQTLKDISFSNKGDISINRLDIVNQKNSKPKLLILTHSSYFFNISRMNNVVNDNATFSLYQDGNVHKVEKLSKYIAPFQQQLEHVFKVSEGYEPNYSTANAIRSVLEAIGHFCMPDKSEDFQNFIAFLIEEKKIEIKSVFINSLCHGDYYEETSSPKDLKLACMETISVVENFTPGQLELVKNGR